MQWLGLKNAKNLKNFGKYRQKLIDSRENVYNIGIISTGSINSNPGIEARKRKPD
jgi:hypothetical protein